MPQWTSTPRRSACRPRASSTETSPSSPALRQWSTCCNAPPVPARPRKAGQARDYGRHWTPVHVDFVVTDVEAAAQRALAAGAVQESERVDWMGSKCITFSDPFGHGFCLIEFEDRTYSHERDSPSR